MFVPDRLKANAYRVLRVSANATLSEIHNAAASMRRAAKLAVTGTSEDDWPHLGEVPRAQGDIRTAVGRLENPEQRLSDRLFWFNLPLEPQANDTRIPTTEPVTAGPTSVPEKHDVALKGLFAALEAALDDAGITLWVEALQAWHRIVCDDEYWAFSLELEERGTFEPAALPSEIDNLRDDAVRLAAEPLLVAARDAFVRSDMPTVRRILVAFEALSETGPWAALAQEDISSPAVARFRALCLTIREECGSKIVREEHAANSNKTLCDAALKRFRGEVQPTLAALVAMFAPTQESAQQAREESALCLSGIAADYTWANEFIVSEQLNEEALALAHDTLGAMRIEHGLEQVRKSARTQRVFGKSISSAPPLSTINGFGFAMYGSSDYDAETQSYSTTHYFVALFIPIFPLGRYRVINAGGNRYRFLGKVPLRKADRWHLGIAGGAIVAMILGGVVSSGDTSTSSYTRPSRFSSYSRSIRTTEPPAGFVVDSPSSSSSDASQPDSKASLISDLDSRIKSGRSHIAALETKLRPVAEELKRLDTQIDVLDAELKSLKAQKAEGVEIDIDDYNAHVRTYNALLAKRKALISANIADLQIYDDLEKQDAALVAKYNALIK